MPTRQKHEIAERQEGGAASDGQEPIGASVAGRERMVPDQPAPSNPTSRPAPATPAKRMDEHTKACRDYAASLRSGWERDYAGAIAAARKNDAARLVDLLRAERPLTSADFEALADYVEELHRPPGREGDPSLREKARETQALLDFFLPRLRSRDGLSRKIAPEEVREWIYLYVCGVNPQIPDKADVQKLKEVETLREHIRKGRHRKPAP
jgi:hypothetical protein